MSKGIISGNGLKYTLSDDVYAMISEKPELFTKLNYKVEASEGLKSFVSVLVFIILAMNNAVQEWYLILAYAMLARVAATIISYWTFIFFVPFVTGIMAVYSFFTRFFLHLIAVMLVSIFVIEQWYVGVLFAVCGALVDVIMIASIGQYSQREVFNDAVAKWLYNKYN